MVSRQHDQQCIRIATMQMKEADVKRKNKAKPVDDDVSDIFRRSQKTRYDSHKRK